MINVDKEWDDRKANPWDCADGLIWPSDFLPGSEYDEEDPPPDYKAAAEQHAATVRFWIDRLTPYRGIEGQIPIEWSVTYNSDGELLDGMHRLTAAKIVGLKTFPEVIDDHWIG
jgi:hypothetical protein